MSLLVSYDEPKLIGSLYETSITMRFCVCESEECGKYIMRENAHVFHDKEGWEHYSCKNLMCMTNALIANDVEKKRKEALTVKN